MSRIQSQPDFVQEAEQAVRAFLRLALSERFLVLHTEDILGAAECVWNNYQPGSEPPEVGMSISLSEVDPEPTEKEEELFDALIEELHQVRGERFAEMSFFVLALDYEYEEDDVLFTCDLMWPDAGAIHPFELRLSRELLAPPGRN